MRSFYKYSFIIAGCMVCIGLMFGIVGIIFGGPVRLVSMLENGELSWGPSHYTYTVSGEDFAFCYDTPDLDWETADGDGITYDNAEVTDMELKIGGGALKVVPYDGDKYKIVAKNSNKYETGIHGGTLFVKSRDKSTNRRDIVVYVPKDYSLEDVKISIGAGYAELEDLECEKLDAEIGAGKFDGDNLKAAEVRFKIGAGSAQLEEVQFGESDFDVGLGSAEIDGEIEGSVKIDCSMGAVNLDLEGSKEDYNYKVNCSAGGVNIDGDDFAGMGSERKIDNGSDKDIKIDCNMGAVNINF